MATEHNTLTADNLHASFPHGNIADIPASPTNLYNNFYFADDENNLYYYNGSMWINFVMDIDLSNATDTAFSTILNRVCPQATCSTASATAAKTVAITGFSLTTGVRVKVTFTNANTADTPTLNIESTGDKAIYNEAGIAVSATSPAYFPAGATVEFYYDGTNWVYVNKVVDSYVNGYAGYKKYSNGFIEQWNKQIPSTGVLSVSFLINFKSTSYLFCGNVVDVSATFNDRTVYLITGTRTTSGCTLRVSSDGVSSGADVNYSFWGY